MRRLVATACLALSCSIFCGPMAAQTNKPAYPESRAQRRAEKKQEKAQRRYYKKQKKAADKMFKQSQKKSHYPKKTY